MIHLKKSLSMLFFLGICLSQVFAQDSKKYKEMAADVEQSMWGSKDPMFESNAVPEQYKNESAIVLAQKYSIATDSKRKTGLFGLPAKNYIDKKIWRNFRQKIVINDQASLTEFSEISFAKLDAKRSSSVMGGKDYAFTFIGIRVIKPSGKIENITVDESAVTVKETKDGKKNKIAIPNLAVGDIIDYYISSYEQVGTGTNTRVASDNPEILTFALTDDYVVLKFNLTLVLDKRIAAEYQTINGAPDFKIKQQEDDNILEINSNNIVKTKDLIWAANNRQLPMIRIRFVFGDLHAGTADVVKKGEIKKDTESYLRVERQIKDALTSSFLSVYNTDGTLKTIRYYFDNRKKRLEKERPSAVSSSDSLAALAYYFARKFVYFNDELSIFADYEDPDRGFSLYNQLFQALRMRSVFENGIKIDCEFINIAPRYSVSRKSVFEVTDLSLLLRINTSKPTFLYLGNVLYNYGEVPTSFEGEDGAYFSIKPNKNLFGSVAGYKVEDEGVVKIPMLPKEAHSENNTLTINMVEGENQLLNIKRKVSATGQNRRAYQATLLMPEDMIKYERASFGDNTDLVEEYAKNGREGKKNLKEFQTRLAKAREKEKEKYETEIKNEYENKPKELKSFKATKLGLRHKDDNVFEMEEEFVMDGWVKKAGNNYIIEAGKFIGGQMEIKQDQRDRKLDIYLPYQRTFSFHIDFIIPEGYTAEGLDKLNKKQETAYGGFVSTAKIDGNKVVIDVTKYYNQPVVKVADFAAVASFVDLAFEFSKEKILLKKK